MGFWNAIGDTVKAGTKILRDNWLLPEEKVEDQWDLANDNAIENNINEATNLINQESLSGAWAVSDIPEQPKSESPIKNITWKDKPKQEPKGIDRGDELDKYREAHKDESFLDSMKDSAWEILSIPKTAYDKTIWALVDRAVPATKEFVYDNIEASKAIDALSQIEWVNPIQLEDTNWIWIKSAVEDLSSAIKKYDEDVSQLGSEAKQKHNTLNKDDYETYIVEEYNPALINIKKENFGSYTEDWNWFTKKQLDSVRPIVNDYNKKALDKYTELFPEQAKEQETYWLKISNIIKKEELASKYLDSLKEFGVEITDDPHTLNKAWQLAVSMWRDLIAVDMKPSLSNEKKEEYKEVMLKEYDNAIALQAMIDAWKTEEEIRKEMERRWVDSRSIDLKKFKSGLMWWSSFLASFLWSLWTTDRIENILREADQEDLREFSKNISSVLDINNWASREVGVRYNNNISPFFDAMNLAKMWEQVKYWYYWLWETAQRSKYHSRNKWVDIAKKTVEVWANAAAVILTEWAFSWLWVEVAGTARGASMIEWLSSFFVKTWMQDRIIEWALTANMPEMNLTAEDQQLNSILNLFGAVVDWVVVLQKASAIETQFKRFENADYSHLVELSQWRNMTLKQKQAINKWFPAVESTIRTLNKANPELMNLLVKEKLFKKQFYRYLNDIVIPKRNSLVEFHWWDIAKATKDFDVMYKEWIEDQMKQADMIKNHAISVKDFIDETNPVYNSAHDAPKVSDITNWKPRMEWDSIEDTVSYYTSDDPAKKVKTNLKDSANVSMSDNKESINKKITDTFSTDPDWAKDVLAVVNFRNSNWELVYFDWDAPNKLFEAMSLSKWMDFDLQRKMLVKDNLILTLKNISNNWLVMVGEEINWKIQYRKATDAEKDDQSIIKFKIDNDQLLPIQESNADMVYGKRTNWKMTDMQVATSDELSTVDINWKTYVNNPVQLNRVIKEDVKHTRKIDVNKAQDLYVDYISKVYDKEKDIKYLTDNDLYIKIHDSIEWETSMYRHSKTANVLDSILQQPDSTKLLEVAANTEWQTFNRFVNYSVSSDPKLLAEFIATYKWPNLRAVKRLWDASKAWENIVVKNHIANMLVDKWTFANMSDAYKYVSDNYERLVTYSLNNADSSKKEFLIWASPKFTLRKFWIDRVIADPLTEFFYFNDFSPEIKKLIYKLSDEYNIIKTNDMDKKVRGEINYDDRSILINWLFANRDYAFGHEFWHWLSQSFTDETMDIVRRLYAKDKAKAVKALMKKSPGMDAAWAEDLLQHNSIYRDSKSDYYIGPDYYMAKNESEWIAENVARYLRWNVKQVTKEFRTILQRIVDWIKEVIRVLSWNKDTGAEFKKIMDNIDWHIDDKIKNIPKEEKESLIGNIEFTDKEWASLIETDIAKPVDLVPFYEEIESKILQYVDENGWLSLSFLNSTEDFIDLETKNWTRRNREAKKVLHSYFDKYFNNKIRNIIDIDDLDYWIYKWIDVDAIETENKSFDVFHEMLLSKWKLEDVVSEMWYVPKSFKVKINTTIKKNSNAFNKRTAGKKVTQKMMDESINAMVDDFRVDLMNKAKKNRKVSQKKVNSILNTISDTEFNIEWPIYNFKFEWKESWNKPMSATVYNEAYKMHEFVVPLPWKLKTITKKTEDLLKDLSDKEKKTWAETWIIEKKIKYIVDSLPKEWKSYIIADYDINKYRDTFTKKMDEVPDVTLIKSNVNNISLRADDWAIRIWSYNKNAFDILRDSLSSIINIKKDVAVNGSMMEVSADAAFLNDLTEYFYDAGIKMLPDSVYKFENKPAMYYINMINARKSTMNNKNNYMFVDMPTIQSDISKRYILTPTHEITVDDILRWEDVDTYAISKWFLETINDQYWFDLKKNVRFPAEKLDLIKRFATRSYASANNADLMMAQLKLMKEFMQPTTKNKELYNELVRPLFHRNIMNTVDLDNQWIRSTVKNLFYEDLMSSWLPTATSSYIMRLDDVVEYMLKNSDDIKTVANDLLKQKRAQWDIKDLDTITLPYELSKFLDNYYKLNKDELVKYYNEKIWWTPWDEKVLDASSFFVGDTSRFDTNKTAQKWLVLSFFDDLLTNIVNDNVRVAESMNFHLYDPLTKWRYVVDDSVFRYVHWLASTDVSNIIKKENFNKILDVHWNTHNKLRKNTEELLNKSVSNLESFFKTSVDAWSMVAWKKDAPYFFKKEQIDNLFGEIYYEMRTYMNFLEKNFWWTKTLNWIISKVKASTYNLDKFSRVNKETLKLYEDFVDNTLGIIKEWHDDILIELKNMRWEFDMNKLIQWWRTGKLTTWVTPDGKKILITDDYTLPDFLKTEAEELWYKMPDGFLEKGWASQQQLKLVWMYTESLQDIIDNTIKWYTSKHNLEWMFYKYSRLSNPFRWKESLSLAGVTELNEKALKFWTAKHMPSFNVYRILNFEADMPKLLNNFFSWEWIKLSSPDVVNVIDLMTKHNLTFLTEAYINWMHHVWRNRKKDIKRMAVYSFFKSLYDNTTPEFVKTFSRNINNNNDSVVKYINTAVDYMSMVMSSRVWLKEIKTADMIKTVQRTDIKFKTLSKKFLDIIDALKWRFWSEALNAIIDSNMWLTINWQRLSIANAISNWDVMKKIFEWLRWVDEKILKDQLELQAKRNFEDAAKWSYTYTLKELAAMKAQWASSLELQKLMKPKIDIDDWLEDMVSLEEKALNEIYWKSGDKYDRNKLLQDSKDKIDKRVDEGRDFNHRAIQRDWYKNWTFTSIDNVLPKIINNNWWVNQFVDADWTLKWTSDLQSKLYVNDKEWGREFEWGDWQEDYYQSVWHPKFDWDELSQQLKESINAAAKDSTDQKVADNIVKSSNDKLNNTEDLFTNCLNI